MTQTTHHWRSGWQQDEIDLLFESVAKASNDGQPLRDVFSVVGEKLSRKPNSIRNFYYAKVREVPTLAPRQSPFRAFEEEELMMLLKEVLLGRGRGESVRACVMRLADGDRSGMLRYQNKYRSILKNKPELLLSIAEELKAQGLPCPQNVLACRQYGQSVSSTKMPNTSTLQTPLATLEPFLQDESVLSLVNSLAKILTNQHANDLMQDVVPYQKWAQARREADRLRVEVDLLRIALEDANEAHKNAPSEDPSSWT